MQSIYRKLLFELYRLIDLCAMLFALAIVLFFFSAKPAYDMEAPLTFFAIKIKLINVILLGIILVLWQSIFSSFGLYKSQRLRSMGAEFVKVLQAVGYGTLLFAALTFLFDRDNITPRTVIAFWIICSLMTAGTRFLLRILLFQLREHGRNLWNIIVVGDGRRGHAMVSELLKRKETGYHFMGFVDEHPRAKVNGAPGKFLCTFQDFPEYLENNIIDEVFITLPMKSYYTKISEIIQTCEQQGILVSIPGNFFEAGISKVKSTFVDDSPYISYYTGQDIDLTRLILKRVIDVFISLVLLVLCSPVLLLITILLKLTSKGPVFFIQERVGYNKRIFRLFKFRTMVIDAEQKQSDIEHLNEADGPIFKIKNDPRITPVGKFLRRTSLDELPQLFNVLLGDMSLVGPRPLPVRDVRRFDTPWYRRRFSVRPGITGLWQVNGRNETQFKSFIKYDLEYVDNWSPGLDIKILLKTMPVVLSRAGAM